ncbi:hypothetical protein CLUG_00830 [Clavispora lusitaniae ATCC 42720]|uniref:Uncharacterized protein n=1 Tax=Clavispora lusitaniae (strain ATCC 42720) TaxID=306902 RepID=C4XY07_CLAL4|nr:uncharacterized protein CLUG_00830 [Clavispora lusitaniae ATCC 42720]EEQ36707.1 hypothetical protein CLUG_00830 [Clavispora lusitaniae ATCC 42720]
MKHPLLRNPAKWLRGVEKGHSAKLYKESYYDSQLLKANPFANALVSTRKDVSNFRFPLGSMVQVIVKKEHEAYNLVPVLEKPKVGQNPASYVIESEAYIDFLSKRHFKPIPLKYRHRSSSMADSIQVPKDFLQRAESIYLNRIEALLPQLKRSGDNNGIVLKPSPAHIKGQWENSTYVIYAPFCTEEQFIPYKGNSELCFLLTRYIRFKDFTNTKETAKQASQH